MIWSWVKIKDIKSCEKYSLVGGPFGSNLSGKHYVEDGVPVIRGANLPFSKKFDCSSFVFVSEEKANRLISNTAYPGDIVFTQRGTLGQVGIVPDDYERYIVSQSQMKLTVDETKASPLFIYYYFRTEECIKRIENVALSSGVPHTNLGILQEFKIPFPPLLIQNKIASILSAYDDLIENNNQRIQLLEEMAEEIYKEWFVRLRFPGYEDCKYFDKEGKEVERGTVGALPEGWTIKKFRECLLHYIGGGWGEEYPKGKKTFPAHVIRGTDFPKFNIGQLNFDILRFHAESNLASRICQPRDIIFEVSGGTETQSLGRTIFLTKDVIERFGDPVIGASFCKLIRVNPKIISPFFINSLLKRMHSTGELKVFQVQSTGISNYQFEDFIDATKIFIPEKPIQNKFQKIIEPMINEVQLLGAKNQLLQETRDLLLPRLISGKLSVEEITMKV